MGQAQVVSPPLRVRLAYRFGIRVPREWVSWVEADLDRPGWLRRQILAQLVIIAVLCVVVPVATAVAYDDFSISDLIGVLVLLVLGGLQFTFAPRLERTRLFVGNRRLILAYHRGGRGDFWAPSRSTIPWMVAGVAISVVIVFVVRSLA